MPESQKLTRSVDLEHGPSPARRGDKPWKMSRFVNEPGISELTSEGGRMAWGSLRLWGTARARRSTAPKPRLLPHPPACLGYRLPPYTPGGTACTSGSPDSPGTQGAECTPGRPNLSADPWQS